MWKEAYLSCWHPAPPLGTVSENEVVDTESFCYRVLFKSKVRSERNWLNGKFKRHTCTGAYEADNVTVLEKHPTEKSILVAGENSCVR